MSGDKWFKLFAMDRLCGRERDERIVNADFDPPESQPWIDGITHIQMIP